MDIGPYVLCTYRKQIAPILCFYSLSYTYFVRLFAHLAFDNEASSLALTLKDRNQEYIIVGLKSARQIYTDNDKTYYVTSKKNFSTTVLYSGKSSVFAIETALLFDGMPKFSFRSKTVNLIQKTHKSTHSISSCIQYCALYNLKRNRIKSTVFEGGHTWPSFFSIFSFFYSHYSNKNKHNQPTEAT